jgi:hypothetical protein
MISRGRLPEGQERPQERVLISSGGEEEPGIAALIVDKAADRERLLEGFGIGQIRPGADLRADRRPHPNGHILGRGIDRWRVGLTCYWETGLRPYSDACSLTPRRTLNERKSRYCLIAHVPSKTAQAVSDTMISLLRPFAARVHTLTTDNGREFAQHERIARELDAQFFFAHPYAFWERGANENMNGLIRQFFPQRMRFQSITRTDIELAMHRLNHRPRKCLGFETPHEVFMKQLHSRHSAVALQA